MVQDLLNVVDITSIHSSDYSFDLEQSLGLIGIDFKSSRYSFKIDHNRRAIGIFLEHDIL